MNYTQNPPNAWPPPPLPDMSRTFFAKPNGPWWRMPRELQQMVLQHLGRHQLRQETGKAAHWFTLDATICKAPTGKIRIQTAQRRDIKKWLPEHPTSFMRLCSMERPYVISQPGDGYVYMPNARQFTRWANQTTYFSRLNPSMSRRRRDLFRTPIPGHTRALRRLIRDAARTNRPYIFAQLPRANQLDRLQWIIDRPRGKINGLPASAPPAPANPPDGFSYMVIDAAEDLVIIQNQTPLPDPRFIGNQMLLDHFLISGVYTQMQHQRQIAYELNLVGDTLEDYENPASQEHGQNPTWQPLLWSVVHFPRLETVWLVNYSLRPSARPPVADRRFQARGMDFYEVRRPTASNPGVWNNCARFVTLAEKFERLMVTHWEAWCYTRLEDEGGKERLFEGTSAEPLTPGNYSTGSPRQSIPDYRLVSKFWDRRRDHEPEYWERLAPSGPTPRIRVKVLAVLVNGAVDADCK